MAKSKKKYYVVWEGHTPGIYDTWEECLLQVKSYPNAKYKAYPSREEAEEALAHFPGWEKKEARSSISTLSDSERSKIVRDALAVDAACSGNPGRMEYRGVWVKDRAEVFHMGPLDGGTNNIGEFLAIVHALALFTRAKDTKTPIYTDSKTAQAWIRKKKANTKLQPGRSNQAVFELIRRAEQWLASNRVVNPILKWDTDKWGEIPADFGRK